MAIDDKRDVNEASLERRLKLVRGGSRETMPHREPKLELVVNADRELLSAVIANDPHRVSSWLARGANPNFRDADGRTPLFETVLRWKDTAIAEVLLERGADLRVRDKYGQTPLHAAAAFGDEALMRVFLDRGAEIDARDTAGGTPLHCAATLGRIEEATFLVSRGADVSLRDHKGRTPLDRAGFLLNLPEENLWEPLKQLLGGFMTARIIEARPDSLIVRVEALHWKFPEAERQARERGTLTVPCGLFPDLPEPGDCLRCRKGLSPVLDEAWSAARRRELGIEHER